MQFHNLATPVLLAAGLGSAWAQAVWRCADGYADRPCADGRAVVPQAHDPGPAERRRAEDAVRANNRAADDLVRRRTRDEAAANVPSLYVPLPAQAERDLSRAGAAGQRPGRKAEVFTAVVPGTVRKAGKDPAAEPREKAPPAAPAKVQKPTAASTKG